MRKKQMCCACESNPRRKGGRYCLRCHAQSMRDLRGKKLYIVVMKQGRYWLETSWTNRAGKVPGCPNEESFPVPKRTATKGLKMARASAPGTVFEIVEYRGGKR